MRGEWADVATPAEDLNSTGWPRLRSPACRPWHHTVPTCESPRLTEQSLADVGCRGPYLGGTYAGEVEVRSDAPVDRMRSSYRCYSADPHGIENLLITAPSVEAAQSALATVCTEIAMAKITIQLTDDDEARIKEAQASAPLTSRHRVARVALRLGLAVLLEEPDAIVDVIHVDMEGSR